jgi:hypothetical protein
MNMSDDAGSHLRRILDAYDRQIACLAIEIDAIRETGKLRAELVAAALAAAGVATIGGVPLAEWVEQKCAALREKLLRSLEDLDPATAAKVMAGLDSQPDPPPS